MITHKEGNSTIAFTAMIIWVISFFVFYFTGKVGLYISLAFGTVFFLFIVYFFRKPKRVAEKDANAIIAPCDGKVVVIENVIDTEYFNKEVKQISIFMSPLNVHINWYSVSGVITYFKYHKGLKLVAWDPKSSTENERASVVVKTTDGKEILMKQIAGAVARRIVAYSCESAVVEQGQELGFIKFGSRVDLLVPTDVKVEVELGQKVSGNKTVIARF